MDRQDASADIDFVQGYVLCIFTQRRILPLQSPDSLHVK